MARFAGPSSMVDSRSIATIAVLLCVGVTACATVPEHDAGPRLAARFEPFPTDYRILYEPGAETFARALAPLLADAIARVEAGHYRPFAKRVVVHICGTDDCFQSYAPYPPNLAAAVVFDNRLLLHPRLFTTEPWRLSPILMHELSHLHLGQRIGHYSPALPVWFHEGLAALVAEGGGADLAAEEEAERAIRAGKYLVLDNPPLKKRGENADISMAMYYRQAMMLVAHLRALGEARFRELLLAIQERESFDSAFRKAYESDWASTAQTFLERYR
jgi:hypothetical protein